MCAWGIHAGHVHDEGLTVGARSEVDADTRRRAVRAVCALAVDARDAALLLDVLGLDPNEATMINQGSAA